MTTSALPPVATADHLTTALRGSGVLGAVRPIGQAANNIAPRVWWNNLERIFLAVDDLACHELLD